MHRNSKALMVTGLPFGDMLAKDKSCFCNPWRTQSTNKKKIIWAPHFTVKEGITWNVLSVFLDIHKFMVQLAQKYKEHIQIAFKPHPQLRSTLESIWGKAETDSYYKLWETMDNTQLEEGEYLGLMKYSDAMIHDCGSFLIEYLYIDKPVLCTIPENQVRKTMNKFSNMAYDCACHGASIKDIENFVDDIIADKDAQRSRRKQFIDNYLCTKSPNQSCCNIINKILS